MVDREQREQFRRDGYLVVPGAVPTPMVERALQAINHWVATGHDFHDRTEYDAQTSARPLTRAAVVTDLWDTSGARTVAAELVGGPVPLTEGAQIALRFPVEPGADPGPAYPHVDGIPTSTNSVPTDGRIYSFSFLAGVLLSDLPAPGHGNFTVWPGSHLAMAEWFAHHGTRVDDAEALYAAHHAVAADFEPVAVTGRAGDLVLAHYLLLHGVGPHAGPRIRYTVFFRVALSDDPAARDAALVDPWREWPALRSAAGSAPGASTLMA